MGLADVALFFIIAATNLQWVAASAASGPTSLFTWIVGCLAMFVPLCVVVLHLTARYPREGGMYVWVTQAFGPFAGFLTAWSYWYSTLVYFPALLYFTAGNALYADGASGAHVGAPMYFTGFATVAVIIGTLLNLFGLETGKRLVNLAAICRCAVVAILFVMGVLWSARYGFATRIDMHAIIPAFTLKELIFFSIIAFAFVGPEALPFMAEEIREPARSVPRGLALAAPVIIAIYIFGTLGLFAVIDPSKIDSLYGVMQAIGVAATRFGGAPLVACVAVLVALSCLGSVTAWMGANARLPFVAGIDNVLPRAFAWVHPRWKSPVLSLVLQGATAIVLAVLGQSGTTVKGAYDVLVSSTVLATMIPFVFMFAAGVKLAVPKAGITLASIVGLLTVCASIVLSAFPAADDPEKTLAVIKIVGLNATVLLIGALLYRSRARARVEAVAPT